MRTVRLDIPKCNTELNGGVVYFSNSHAIFFSTRSTRSMSCRMSFFACAAEKNAAAKSAEAKAASPKSGEGATAERQRAPKSPATPEVAPQPEKVPDMQPDIQARDQSTKPDKAGVKDQSIGPQAQAGGDDGDDTPARGRNVVDISRESLMVEISGRENKIEAFIDLMRPYEILELARTGRIALVRGQPGQGDVL